LQDRQIIDGAARISILVPVKTQQGALHHHLLRQFFLHPVGGVEVIFASTKVVSVRLPLVPVLVQVLELEMGSRKDVLDTDRLLLPSRLLGPALDPGPGGLAKQA
jgi:hypothetical protein